MRADLNDSAPAAVGAASGHAPVLLVEVVQWLGATRGGDFLDGTFGGGGHTRALLEAHPANRVVAVDRDPAAVDRAAMVERCWPGRFRLVAGNFADLASLIHGTFNGALFDLGVSSFQLDDPARGFSFRHDAPLDLRMNPGEGVPAAEFLETADEEALVRALRDYGEETAWRRVLRAILAARGTGRLARTGDFARLVADAVPTPPPGRRRIHPATRVFQGVRIAVNRELEAIEAMLPAAFDCLAPGGRLAVISFHSLEDRIVKRAFRRLAGRPEHGNDSTAQQDRVVQGSLPFNRPVVPGPCETSYNPRARSARLRVLVRNL